MESKSPVTSEGPVGKQAADCQSANLLDATLKSEDD
jgi:hypothetical protein